jgi:hypothetical protein
LAGELRLLLARLCFRKRVRLQSSLWAVVPHVLPVERAGRG